jgi:drug/metabolite transporter (DMT)-like permease
MWFLFSLGSAFFAGTSDVVAKKALQTHRAETIAWVKPGWGALFMLPVFLSAAPPHHPREFWIAIICAIPLEVLGALCFQTAVQISPLSLCIPYLAFTPVFLLGGAWIFLHEVPTLFGVLGVFSVTIGAVLLQRETITWKDLFSHRIFPKEKGPLLMLFTAFLFSITTIFARKALDASSPFYFSGMYYFLIALGLLPFQFKSGLKQLIKAPPLFLLIGFVETSSFLLQFMAMPQTTSAYVIAIKRLSLLFSVVSGWIFFKEKHVISRLIGASLMVVGVVLIAFA